MDDLRRWLDAYVPLTEDAWSALRNDLKPLALRKGERFQAAGRRANTIAFLVKGTLYARHSGTQRRHSVAYFNHPTVNRVVCDLAAFVEGASAALEIAAAEDCELLALDRKQLYCLYAQHPTIERLGRRLAEYSYCKAMERIGRMELKQHERVADFWKRYPEVMGVLQDQLIADYLGMSPTYFSRIKRRLLKGR